MVRPRKPGSGGPRVGAPATAYGNRTDLNSGHQAVSVAPGQPYGQAGQQAAAQKAIPLPTQTPAPVGQPAPAGGVTATAPGPSAPPAVVPGSMGAFNRPTERPNEPITAGLPSGPGPGPEALSLGPQPNGPLSQTLAQLAKTSGSSDLAQLAQRAQQMGQ